MLDALLSTLTYSLLFLWVCGQMFNSAWFYTFIHVRSTFELEMVNSKKNSIIKWGRDIPALFLQWRRMMSVTSVWYCIFYILFWCPCFCFLSGSWISAWEDHSREPSYKLCRTTTCTGRHNWSYPKAYTSSSIILRMNLKSYFWEALLWYVSWWTLGFETLMTSKNLYFCCIITHMMDLC